MYIFLSHLETRPSQVMGLTRCLRSGASSTDLLLLSQASKQKEAPKGLKVIQAPLFGERA